MVTSRDVARAAGVSQATVSRVLQGSSRVTPETRERVLQALQEVGYTPNLLARAMRTQRIGTIGVVVARVTNPFYPEIIEALDLRLAEAGYRMLLLTSDGAGEANALEVIRQGLIDGLIFTTVTGDSRPLSAALERGSPIVLLNRGVPDLPCDQVMTENAAGGEAAARYLFDWGHERIGCIGGPSNASTVAERLEGFRGALEAQGYELDPAYFREGDFSHETARTLVRELLSAGDPAETVSALFCVNDLTAFGAIDAARSLDVRVPEDLWVIGFDDISMASWDSYSLTTVRQPIDDMVDTSVKLLLERIERPERSYQHVRFPSELIVRASTAGSPDRTRAVPTEIAR